MAGKMPQALEKHGAPAEHQPTIHQSRVFGFVAKKMLNRFLLNPHQLICNMSKKGNCYNNAAMESCNHSFKAEAIHGEQLPKRAYAKQQVFEYIEVYYNRKRLHSKLGYLSPEVFELKLVS